MINPADAERTLHLVVGLAYGYDATCGVKIDYKSRETASKAAHQLTEKNARQRPGSHPLEAYPCPWCMGWHIGRALTEHERSRWSYLVMTILHPDNQDQSQT